MISFICMISTLYRIVPKYVGLSSRSSICSNDIDILCVPVAAVCVVARLALLRPCDQGLASADPTTAGCRGSFKGLSCASSGCRRPRHSCLWTVVEGLREEIACSWQQRGEDPGIWGLGDLLFYWFRVPIFPTSEKGVVTGSISFEKRPSVDQVEISVAVENCSFRYKLTSCNALEWP